MLAYRSGVRGSRRKYEVNHKKAKDKMKFKMIRHSCPLPTPDSSYRQIHDSLFTTFILKFIFFYHLIFLYFTSYFLFLREPEPRSRTPERDPTCQHITKFKKKLFCVTKLIAFRTWIVRGVQQLTQVSSFFMWWQIGRLSSFVVQFSYFSMKISDDKR